MTRLERPLYWGKDAPDSPFGVHVLSADGSLKAVKAAGVNWARLHDAGAPITSGGTGWSPKKGKWIFRDDDIMAYRRNQIKVFGQFGTRAEMGELALPSRYGKTVYRLSRPLCPAG